MTVIKKKSVQGRANARNPVRKTQTIRKVQTDPKPIKPVSDRFSPDKLVQENLLAVLCCNNDEAGKMTVQRIDPCLFEGDYRVIAERVCDYRRKYKKPPGISHLHDLFPDIVDGKHAKSQTYIGIMDKMILLAENSAFNVPFVRDQLDEFERSQGLKARIVKAAELSHAGQTEAAEEVLRQTTPITRTRTLTSRSMDTFEPREIDWLWYPFIPLGELTIFYGMGDTGKSTITIDTAVRVTKGAPWPCFGNDKPENAPKGSTLFVTRENDPNSVLRPRLEAAGATIADLKHIHFVGYEDADDDTVFDAISTLDTNMQALEERIAEIGDVKLVVIDPAPDFVGKVDVNASEELRHQFFAPLLRIARKFKLAVVFILHTNKKEDAAARNRATGSEAWINAPRSAVVVGKNPDDPSQHVMVLVKHNLAPGARGAVTFFMESVGRSHKVKFERDYADVTAEQLLAQKKGASKLDKAKELLTTRLTDGSARVEELVAEAAAIGISERTLRSAKRDLNIRSKKDGLAGWVWLFRRKKV
jgi:hypothetical protein